MNPAENENSSPNHPDDRRLPVVKIQSLTPTGSVGAPPSAPVPLPAHLLQPASTAKSSAPMPVPVQSVMHDRGPVPMPLPAPAPPPRRVLAHYWRAVGGGSLMVSVLIHACLLVGAFFLVKTVVTESEVDFIPGGRSKAGEEAAQALTAQLRKKPPLAKPTPMRRVVIDGPSITSLPDLPMDTLDMPAMSSFLGGGGMSAGSFSRGPSFDGTGGGPGTAKSTFLARTVFGTLGGEGVPGSFYDLKQNASREPIEYDVNNYAAIIAGAASRKFAPASLKDYYKATQQMSFSFLAVLYTSAEEGPKAFSVEKEVQPRGWFVHYSGMITPPQNGEWRFVGNFDDALVVYINNKPVLDGSWLNIGNHGARKPDEEIRQAFGGPPVLTSAQRCWAGKWVRMDGPTKIDIIVGERPGGRVGGLLLVQHKKTGYTMRPDGSPVLPVFTTAQPDMADIARMKEFAATKPEFELELNDIPVFKVNAKSALEGGSALDRMRLGKKN